MNDTLILANSSKPKVMSLEGRIGRVRLLAWGMALFAATMGGIMLVAMLSSSVSMDLGGLVMIGLLSARILSMLFIVQRLHDLNWSGWFCWLSVLPWVGNFLLLVLVLMPGTRGSNRFGPPPAPNNNAVVILAWLWLVLLAGVAYLAAIRPGI
ncbi:MULTISPECIES: DUF805 domain-containing protein [Pseudomonas]|uniref:DUF805 domain-containing protein n=1 Tax=Pseudomonas fluorescens TaxID=294 RepID=A0A5E6W1W3_PSEFL|nr:MULTISPECIES: DUF805 domain-containing protein [Pseudomonas]VVN22678.1 hypothetical protein PS652_04411 [Pseudomonas fluorescens]